MQVEQSQTTVDKASSLEENEKEDAAINCNWNIKVELLPFHFSCYFTIR